MTIAELYEWAKEHGVENVEFVIQNADGGGYYCGTHEPCPEIEEDFDGKVDKVTL